MSAIRSASDGDRLDALQGMDYGAERVLRIQCMCERGLSETAWKRLSMEERSEICTEVSLRLTRIEARIHCPRR